MAPEVTIIRTGQSKTPLPHQRSKGKSTLLDKLARCLNRISPSLDIDIEPTFMIIRTGREILFNIHHSARGVLLEEHKRHFLFSILDERDLKEALAVILKVADEKSLDLEENETLDGISTYLLTSEETARFTEFFDAALPFPLTPCPGFPER